MIRILFEKRRDESIIDSRRKRPPLPRKSIAVCSFFKQKDIKTASSILISWSLNTWIYLDKWNNVCAIIISLIAAESFSNILFNIFNSNWSVFDEINFDEIREATWKIVELDSTVFFVLELIVECNLSNNW